MNIDFFKSIYKDDIIYHYTKAATAIDYILFDNQLRFSRGSKSNDPIESSSASRGTVYYENIDRQQSKNHLNDADELHEFVGDLEIRFQKICFCKNSMGDDFASKNYHTQFEGHEELFGFAKPRMWDQYADKFTGVCLAFSKKKILSLNDSELELIEGNLKYLTFRQLWENKVGDIQGDYLSKAEKGVYRNQLDEQVKQSFFFKHKDYAGENEYRIGTLYDKNKCCVEKVKNKLIFDETMMLDTTNCIEAIFMSNYANVRQKGDLLKYADTLSIPLVEMNWLHNSIEYGNYREQLRLLSIIKDSSF